MLSIHHLYGICKYNMKCLTILVIKIYYMLHTQAYTEYLLYVFKTMFSQHIWHIKPKKKLLLILYECISSNFTLA